MSKTLFFKSVSFGYLRQIITLVIGVVSLPLTLNYFGSALYGILVLVLGLAGYLNNIAFGIPSAMITLVAKTSDLHQKYLILKKSFYILVTIVSILLGIFLIIVTMQDDWIISILGNIDVQYIQIAKNIFIVFVIVALVKIPLALYVQFFIGLNLVYISEIYQIFTMILSLIVILFTLYMKLDIYMFVVLTLCAQLIVNLSSMIHVLCKYTDVRNNLLDISEVSNSQIVKSGFAFFQVGIAASIVWSTDNLVISHFLSPEYVTSYSIAFKIFTYMFLFSAIINGVISPIYGNAYAQQDWNKIKRISSMILKILPILGAGVWIFLIFFSKELIYLWTHNEEAFGGYLLVFSLGLYGYVLSFVNTYATLISSLNYAGKTLNVAWLEAFLNLIFSIFLIHFLGIGGVALGTALASFFSAFLLLPKAIKILTHEKIIYEYSYVKKHFIFLVIPSLCVAFFSIYCEILVLKIVLFCFVVMINLYLSWKLLTLEEQNMLLNLVKREKSIE